MAGTWWSALGEGIKGAGQGVNTFYTLKQQAMENALRERQQREAEAERAEGKQYRDATLGLSRDTFKETQKRNESMEQDRKRNDQIALWKVMGGGEFAPEVADVFDPTIRPLVGKMVEKPDQVRAWSGIEGEQGPVVDSWQRKFQMNTPADQEAEQKRAQLEAVLARIGMQGELGAARNAIGETNANAATSRAQTAQQMLQMQREQFEQAQRFKFEQEQREEKERARNQALDEYARNPAGFFELFNKKDEAGRPIPFGAIIDARADEIIRQQQVIRPQRTGAAPSIPNFNIK